MNNPQLMGYNKQVVHNDLAKQSPEFAKARVIAGETPVPEDAAVRNTAADVLKKLRDKSRDQSDFKFSISPSEKEKAAKLQANKQEFGEFDKDDNLIRKGERQIREDLLEAVKTDFVIINDVPISGAAVANIAVQTDTDVFIAETLRASNPIIEPKGTGLDMVSISLAFPNGSSQTVFLRRIVAEIIRHPFVFIENQHIREAIGYGTKSMIFALHSASLRSGGEATGVIYLDLQLSIFNYKPFSNHYWYNTILPGHYKSENNRSRVAEALLPDYGGRYSFDHSINKYEEFAFEDLSPSDFSTNTPTVYPADSAAWMYYAKHLEDKIPEGTVGERNNDYVGLVLTRYKMFQPPRGAREGRGDASKIFGVHGVDKDVPGFFRAKDAIATLTEKAAAEGGGENGASASPTGGSTNTTSTEHKAAPKNNRGPVSRPSGKQKYQGSRAIAARRLREEKPAIYSAKGKTARVPDSSEEVLNICKALYGEGGPRQSPQRTALYLWAQMNRCLLMPGLKSKSYIWVWKAHSQPINEKWARGGKFCVQGGKGYGTKRCNEAALRRRERISTLTWDDMPPRLVNAVFDFRAGIMPPPVGHETVADWGSQDWAKAAVIHGGMYWNVKKGRPFYGRKRKKGESVESVIPLFSKDQATAKDNPNYVWKEVQGYIHGKNKYHGEAFFTKAPLFSNRVPAFFDNSGEIQINRQSRKPGEATPIVKEATDTVDKRQEKQGKQKDKTEAKKLEQAKKEQQAKTEKRTNPAKDNADESRGANKPKERPQQSLTTPQSVQDRDDWISNMEDTGWTYHNEAGARNIFYKDEYFFVGGSASPEKDIILSAVTVNFGHRLAQMKPLGQHAPSWQFMGAGNKTGIFVFSAANEGGKESLRRFRKFYQTSQENVRLFPYIEGSGAIRVESSDLNEKDNINNILALAGIKEIVVTNIESQVDSSQGVNIHSLVVSWIGYEVPTEELKARDNLDVDVKLKMMKTLMKHMKFWTSKVGDSTYQSYYYTSGLSLPAASGNHAYYKTEQYQKDFKKFQYRLRETTHHIGPHESILTWNREQGRYVEPENSKYKDVRWYVDLVRRLDKVLQKYKVEFPDLNIQHPGSKKGYTWANKVKRELGVKGLEVLQGKAFESMDRDVFGFKYYSSYKERQRIVSQKYSQLLDDIANNVIDHALSKVGDAENFKKLFGNDVWKSIMNSYLTEPGECYIDLDMPPEITGDGRQKGNGKEGVKYPPDFFIYDDSAENAVLDETNNPKNVENMVRSHLVNEARSIHEYSRKIMFGGSSMSQNMIKVRENKANLNEVFGSEYDYFGIGGTMGGQSTVGAIEGFGNRMLAWGMNAFSAVLDDIGGDNEFDTYGETWQAEVNRNIFENASSGPEGMPRKDLTPGQKKIDGFLNMALDWSGTSTNFTLVNSEVNKSEGQAAVREAAKGFLYSSYTHTSDEKEALSQIEFGPDEANMSSDGLVYGMMSPNAAHTTVMDPTTGKPKKLGVPYRDAPAYDPFTFEIDDWSSDIEVAGQENKPNPSKTEEEYLPPAAADDFTDTFARYGAGLATNSRKKDLSMRRAYPTFKIYFIEEDQHQASRKLRAFDDFYSYSCVQEIRVIRSRKVAADLAILRLTNVGDVLLSQRFQRGDDDLMREAGQGNATKVNADGTVTGGKKQKRTAEKAVGLYSQTKEENPYSTMMLQPGVKTQIRLGYAADPDNLETVFLGQIIEVQPTEDNNLVEVVCQGYGAELEAEECGDIEKASPAYSTQSALSAAICLPFVTHFGRREPNALYNPAEIRTYLDGGEAEDFFEWVNPVNILGSVMSSFYHERMRGNNFLNKPQDDNIYAPPVSLYTTAWSRFWDNAAAYRPINATPWDVFKEHELRHPGFIASPVPYGHSGRMTMFFGSKGQNYWSKPPSNRSIGLSTMLTNLARSISWDVNKFYGDGVGAFTPDMRKQLERLQKENPSMYRAFMQSLMGMGGEKAIGFAVGRAFGRYVPFRNYHMFTSEHHILKNSIRANVQGTYNAVEVRYSGDEDIATPKTVLWSEWLGHVFADEGEETVDLLNQVVAGTDGRFTLKLNDKMPDHLVRKHMEAYPSCITDYMASRYAQGLMIRGLKDVYRGELVVIGDERVKPYDICMLQDNKNSMYGPCEVEQVVHIFNSEQGFCSVITPDLCIDFNDFTGKGIMDSVLSIASLAWAIGTDSTMASLAKDYDTSDTVSSHIVASHLAPLDKTYGTNVGKIFGSAMLMHFDQTGSPYIITPLFYGGKPMLGLSLGPNYGNWASNLWGEFTDWYHDFKEGARQFDFGESLQDWAMGAEEWIQEAVGNKPDWDDN